MPNRLIYHLENHHSDLKQVILFLSLHVYIGRNVYNYLQVGSNLGENPFPRNESKRVKRHHGNDESSTNTVYNSTHFVFGIIIVKRFINYRRSWRIWILCGTVISATFPTTASPKWRFRKFATRQLVNTKVHYVVFLQVQVKNHHGGDAVCSLTKPEKVIILVDWFYSEFIWINFLSLSFGRLLSALHLGTQTYRLLNLQLSQVISAFIRYFRKNYHSY